MGAGTARVLAKHVEPDGNDWFTAALSQKWWEEYVANGNLDHPMAIPGSRVRASWSGDCARSIAYHLAGTDESNPFTIADAWRANVGTLLHREVQEIIETAFPGSASEVKVKIMSVGSGHMDLLVVLSDGTTISTEIKSVNGYGFKKMTMGSKPEGVRFKYLTQGALNANGMDPKPDYLLIAVLSLETASPKEAAAASLPNEYRRFAAQWTFSRREFEVVAEEEIARLERIVSIVDTEGPLAVPRTMPDPRLPTHIIKNPQKGIYVIKDDLGNDVGQGQTWQCLYCPFRDQCDMDR